MSMWTRIIFILIIIARTIAAIPIDNQLIGEPMVRCESDTLSINLQTMKQFSGRVFVKGFSRDSNCLKNNLNSSKFNFTIPFDKCGLRRSRELSGVSITVTVIVSFHPIFITKVDRAYKLNCFYLEARKTVMQQLEVNELTTQLLQLQPSMPTCRYEILMNGPNGSPVRYAKIGDHVYHKWSCAVDSPTKQSDMYCMRVHSCSVNDGQGGEQVLVLDRDGCQVDGYVLQNLEYSSDMVAGQGAHVFKFADKPTLHFNCQIEISLKQPPNGCRDAQPQCSGTDSSNPRPVNSNINSNYPNENLEIDVSESNIYQPKSNSPGSSNSITRSNEYGQQRLPGAQFKINSNDAKNGQDGLFDSGYPTKSPTNYSGPVGMGTTTTVGPLVQTQVAPSQRSIEIGYDEGLTKLPRGPPKPSASSLSGIASPSQAHPPGAVPPEAILSRTEQPDALYQDELDTNFPFTTVPYGNSITGAYEKKKSIAKRNEERNKRKVADLDLPEQSYIVLDLDEDPTAIRFFQVDKPNGEVYCVSSALFVIATLLALSSMTVLGVFICISIRRHKDNSLRKFATH